MGGDGGIRRARTRFLVVGVAASVAALFATEPALAQLPLGSEPTGGAPTSGIVGTVTQALPTNEAVAQVAPVVQEAVKPVAAVTQPVAQAAAPVTQATAPVAAQAATVSAPAAQTAAPVVAQVAAPVVQAVEPVRQQTAAPVLESVQPVLDAAAPMLEAAQPLTAPLAETAEPLLQATAPVLDTSAPLLDSTAANPRQSAPGERLATTLQPGETGTPPASVDAAPQLMPISAPASAASSTSTSPGFFTAAAPREHRLAADTSESATARSITSGRPTDDIWPTIGTSVHEGRTTHAATRVGRSRMPGPNEPTGPLGFLGAISAAFGSSGALLLFAALAAFILVVAPGLGRRLRPAMAPWPPPIPLASLERPG